MIVTVRPIYVVGVDPGESVGIRCISPAGKEGMYWQGSHLEAGTVLRTLIRSLPPQSIITIACERFVQGSHGPAMTQHDATREVIAVARGIAQGYGCTFVEQAPAAAKKIASNALLRSMGLLATGTMVNRPDANDVNDATRHALLFIATRYASIFEQMQKRGIATDVR